MSIDQQELVGATSRIWRIWLADSSSITGAGLTGVTAASVTAYYHSPATTAAVLVTLVTIATVNVYTSAGFLQIDATNMPGWYLFCPPNAALATGPQAAFNFKGATNLANKVVLCQLVANDPYTAGVIVTTNNDKTGYTASTVTDKTGYSLSQTFPANFSALSITAGGAMTAGTVSDKTGYTASTVSDKTGYALTQTFPTNFASQAIALTGEVSADVKKINATTVNGDGSGTPWGP